MDIETVVDNMTGILSSNELTFLATLFDIEWNYPYVDDDWPAWQNGLQEEVNEALIKKLEA